ncbi:hypothetical protein CYMTET_48314 [Cymbomonas tetramitiformis]|uniref:Uncharacterized protein n=1 Tax=Cymbomonas tetramitiformis TaxID=36881 RepID=A0AAE0EVV9_9CHLO|nr:hypothetical protein CYMTET_48314 [Cymbomonas tetramitiformis]
MPRSRSRLAKSSSRSHGVQLTYSVITAFVVSYAIALIWWFEKKVILEVASVDALNTSLGENIQSKSNSRGGQPDAPSSLQNKVAQRGHECKSTEISTYIIKREKSEKRTAYFKSLLKHVHSCPRLVQESTARNIMSWEENLHASQVTVSYAGETEAEDMQFKIAYSQNLSQGQDGAHLLSDAATHRRVWLAHAGNGDSDADGSDALEGSEWGLVLEEDTRLHPNIPPSQLHGLLQRALQIEEVAEHGFLHLHTKHPRDATQPEPTECDVIAKLSLRPLQGRDPLRASLHWHPWDHWEQAANISVSRCYGYCRLPQAYALTRKRSKHMQKHVFPSDGKCPWPEQLNDIQLSMQSLPGLMDLWAPAFTSELWAFGTDVRLDSVAEGGALRRCTLDLALETYWLRHHAEVRPSRGCTRCVPALHFHGQDVLLGIDGCPELQKAGAHKTVLPAGSSSQPLLRDACASGQERGAALSCAAERASSAHWGTLQGPGIQAGPFPAAQRGHETLGSSAGNSRSAPDASATKRATMRRIPSKQAQPVGALLADGRLHRRDALGTFIPKPARVSGLSLDRLLWHTVAAEDRLHYVPTPGIKGFSTHVGTLIRILRSSLMKNVVSGMAQRLCSRSGQDSLCHEHQSGRTHASATGDWVSTDPGMDKPLLSNTAAKATHAPAGPDTPLKPASRFTEIGLNLKRERKWGLSPQAQVESIFAVPIKSPAGNRQRRDHSTPQPTFAVRTPTFTAVEDIPACGGRQARVAAPALVGNRWSVSPHVTGMIPSAGSTKATSRAQASLGKSCRR